MIFTTTPANSDEILGMIKGLIISESYDLDANLHPWFEVTPNKDGYIVDYKWTHLIDENGEDHCSVDSFPVLKKDSPIVTMRFIRAMLDELASVDVEVERDSNH